MNSKIVVPLFLVFFLLGSFSRQAPVKNEEYKIKAAFIYKFTNYIEWDSKVSGDEFIIGIIGPSPISTELSILAKSATIKGRKVSIRQYYNAEEIGACHILFISQKAVPPLYEILAYAREKGTLTISENEGDASLGTQLNFVVLDNKMKFEANPKAINAAGLTASSQLLKLAIIVN